MGGLPRHDGLQVRPRRRRAACQQAHRFALQRGPAKVCRPIPTLPYTTLPVSPIQYHLAVLCPALLIMFFSSGQRRRRWPCAHSPTCTIPSSPHRHCFCPDPLLTPRRAFPPPGTPASRRGPRLLPTHAPPFCAPHSRSPSFSGPTYLHAAAAAGDASPRPRRAMPSFPPLHQHHEPTHNKLPCVQALLLYQAAPRHVSALLPGCPRHSPLFLCATAIATALQPLAQRSASGSAGRSTSGEGRECSH